jgi:hypothetical protein
MLVDDLGQVKRSQTLHSWPKPFAIDHDRRVRCWRSISVAIVDASEAVLRMSWVGPPPDTFVRPHAYLCRVIPSASQQQ